LSTGEISVSEKGRSLGLRTAGFIALIAVAGSGPALAQAGPKSCADLSGVEEVECLRKALTQTQEALDRAERALQAPPPAPASAPVASLPPRDTTLGSEQAARRAGTRPTPEEETRVSALIVRSERVFPNQLQVHLENGQIWRQIQGDTQRVELRSDDKLAAEIWQSGFGGYRMRLPTVGRVLRVERIR
jgi:hypothetical protein